MKLYRLPGAAIQVAMMLTCAAAYADEPKEKAGAAADSDLQTITVTATRDPVDKSYR